MVVANHLHSGLCRIGIPQFQELNARSRMRRTLSLQAQGRSHLNSDLIGFPNMSFMKGGESARAVVYHEPRLRPPLLFC